MLFDRSDIGVRTEEDVFDLGLLDSFFGGGGFRWLDIGIIASGQGNNLHRCGHGGIGFEREGNWSEMDLWEWHGGERFG